MYKGKILNSTTVTANADIPFNTVINSNASTVPDANGVIINRRGYFDVYADVSISSGTAGAISLQLYADGEPIEGAVFTDHITTGLPVALGLYDVLKVVPNFIGTKAKISARLSAGATLSNATLIIEERR